MNAARRVVVALLGALALSSFQVIAATPDFVASESIRQDAATSATEAVAMAKR